MNSEEVWGTSRNSKKLWGNPRKFEELWGVLGISPIPIIIFKKLAPEVWSIHEIKDKKKCNWLMKLTLRFTSKEMAKLNFQKIIPKFFDGTFRDLFPGKFWKMMIEIECVMLWNGAGAVFCTCLNSTR